MRVIAIAVLTAGLAACASQPPDWIMRPTAEGGWAATECVKDSGNLSLDRQIAVAKARAEIAKQVELRVAAMDKTYTRLTEEANQNVQNAQPSTGESRAFQSAFESVSKQIAEQTLGGLAPTRVEYVELNDVRNLCAMIAVDRSAARSVYDQVVAASGQRLAPAASEALYQDFTAPAAN
jgi:hypothetical protein